MNGDDTTVQTGPPPGAIPVKKAEAGPPPGAIPVKKGQPSGGTTSSNGAEKSSNGVSPSPNTPKPPDALQDYWKHLSTEEKKALSQGTLSGHPEHVTDATQQEKHYQYMHTPLGKLQGAVQYLGSQATHGGLQVLKGLAHNYNTALGGTAADVATNTVLDQADKLADLGQTPGDIQRAEGNKMLSAAGMAANFAPTILAGEATKAPEAMLYLQGVGQGKEVTDKIPDLHPIAKEALIQGTGAVNLLLSKLGGKIFDDIPAETKSKIATSIAADAVKEGGEVTPQEFTQQLAEKSKPFLQKLQDGGVKAAEHYADNIKTFAALKGATFAMHKGVDLVNQAEGGKVPFDETLEQLAQDLGKTPEEAAIFSAIPAMRSITHEFLDPVAREKENLGRQISDLDTQIKAVSEKVDDPVKQAENDVNLEELTKKREELNNNLKAIIKNDKTTNEGQGGQSSSPEDEKQAEKTVGTDGSAAVQQSGENDEGRKELNEPVTGGSSPPVSEKPKEDAISKQETESLPIQSEAKGGEGVPKGDAKGKETASTGKEKEKPTAITNKSVEEERGEAIPREKKKLDDIHAEAKQKVDDLEIDPEKLAKDVISGKHTANEVDQAALRYHKAKLEKEQRRLLKESEASPEKAVDNHIASEAIEDKLAQNREATEKIGNIAGRTLRDRQEALTSDYSRVHILQRAKQANHGQPLSPELEKELTTRTARIKELEGQLADREEQVRKLQEQNTVSRIGRTRKEVTRAKLREERADILAELHTIARKARSTAGANKIPVEMIGPLTKLAVNYVYDGIVSLQIVVDKVYDDLKDHIEGLHRDDVEEAIKGGFDNVLAEENKKRLESAKKRQQTKLSNLKDQVEGGNIEQRTQHKLDVDNDYLAIRAEINRQQTLINKKIQQINNSKKSIGRKAVDFAVKYGRGAKLASVTVLGKLSATGLTTLAVKVPQEIVGAGISKILLRIAEKAPFEAGANLSAMAKSYAKAATKGMKDAYDEVNIKGGGQSDLKALYGKSSAGRLPADATDFFGALHSAIKAPFKRAIWEYSYAKRFAATAKNGLDPLEPVTDAKNRLDAYKDAERAIFMGDNKISSAYEAAMRTLENSSSGSAKNVAALTRILLPFVKVPTNIALEGGRSIFGLPAGLVKLGRVGLADVARRQGAEKLATLIHKNMGKLTPEESEMVLRNLKVGSVGGAATLVGFFNPKVFGGFYRPQQKQSDKKPEFGGIMIDGVKIPRWMTEHPIFLAAQAGATFRQVLDAHRKKEDGVESAALATASGLAGAIPLANGAQQILESLQGPDKANRYVGSVVKGEVEPAALQQLAEITDTKHGQAFTFDTKEQQKRAPQKKKGMMKYVKQELETGVPGLRQQVPKKK